MKRVLLVAILFLCGLSGVDAQSNFWNGKDAYLAEAPPGDTPRIFAPGRLADSGYFSCDTIVKTLGVPVNAPGWNGDFYISPDESYLIVSAKETKDFECKLFISYRKPDKTWTNPKSLGPLINEAVSHRWGVTVTPDNKYIFYTFGESEKETAIYWARFDRLLETLKNSNFEPYVRDSVPDQQARAGQLFSFKVKDEVFFDDDGNNTLKLSASSSDGGPLPAWLTFNIKERTLSGKPYSPGIYKINLTATDPAGAFAVSSFSIKVDQ